MNNEEVYATGVEKIITLLPQPLMDFNMLFEARPNRAFQHYRRDAQSDELNNLENVISLQKSGDYTEGIQELKDELHITYITHNNIVMCTSALKTYQEDFEAERRDRERLSSAKQSAALRREVDTTSLKLQLDRCRNELAFYTTETNRLAQQLKLKWEVIESLMELAKSIHLLRRRNLQLKLKVCLIKRLLITKLINAKLVLLLVYSLATIVALLRALRSGWGPPLELALSLSNDNYWQVFVDVFADLLACVWSNPDTQHTLLGIFCTLFAVSFLMNGLLIYTLVNGNSATQNSSFYLKSNPSQVELCTAVSSRSELHQALTEVGDWYGLCLGLEISDSISQPLRHSSKDVTDKKRVCLDAFYDLGEGEACWERVVRVVTGYPIHKRGLAKKLAKKFGIDFEDAVTRRNEL